MTPISKHNQSDNDKSSTSPCHHIQSLFNQQAGIILAQEAGVYAGDMTALHDMRVAIRRFRTLIYAFSTMLHHTHAQDVGVRLKQVSDDISHSRDLDVWILFLKNIKRPEQLMSVESWESFLEKQIQQHKKEKEHLKRIIAGDLYRDICKDMCILTTTTIKTICHKKHAGEQIKHLGAGILLNNIKRIHKREAQCRDVTPLSAHNLRKACRRYRYLAEFFHPILGKDIRKTGAAAKRVQDVLGRIHDIDVWLSLLEQENLHPSKTFIARLQKERMRHVKKLNGVWDNFTLLLKDIDLEKRLGVMAG